MRAVHGRLWGEGVTRTVVGSKREARDKGGQLAGYCGKHGAGTERAMKRTGGRWCGVRS